MSTKSISPQLDSSWMEVLKNEFHQPYFKDLMEFIQQEKKGKSILPTNSDIFTAFNITKFKDVKVVIIGQDPYHGEGQAHGLSFSVKRGVRQPPSLKNIFKELQSDLQIEIPDKFNGELIAWAKQGVFLLNAVLTVQQAWPNSHKGKGWEQFTDATIKAISNYRENVVFILWGNYAKKKSVLIDESKHYIISSVHPSPFAARNGFFGSQPFSKTNAFLHQTNQKLVDWTIE